MNSTKILWGQVLVVSLVVLAFVWGDGWVAWCLAFQSQFGAPWFELLAILRRQRDPVRGSGSSSPRC